MKAAQEVGDGAMASCASLHTCHHLGVVERENYTLLHCAHWCEEAAARSKVLCALAVPVTTTCTHVMCPALARSPERPLFPSRLYSKSRLYSRLMSFPTQFRELETTTDSVLLPTYLCTKKHLIKLCTEMIFTEIVPFPGGW